MEIKEIVNEYLQLNIKKNNNEIDEDSFLIKLKELAFIDKSGTWWFPKADATGWEYLDNSEWKTGDPIATEVEPAEENDNFNYEPDPENIIIREEVPEEYFEEKDYDAEFEALFNNFSQNKDEDVTSQKATEQKEIEPIVSEDEIIKLKTEKPDGDLINCFSCNKEIPLNAKFCPFCGTSADTKPKPGFCSKCTKQNPEEAKFCVFCGNNLK